MADPSVATNYNLMSVLAPVGSFVLGFIIAVFADPFRQWWFRPKVKLTFLNDSDHVAYTPYKGGGVENKAYYIRVGVINSSRPIARQCRAYLVNIEKKGKSVFERTLYADSIQLAWSCRIEGSELDAIDIPHGVVQYIDLLATINENNIYSPKIKPFPYRYEDLFSSKSQILRFTVQVSGDAIDPVLIKIVFCWKGQWDKFDVYKEE